MGSAQENSVENIWQKGDMKMVKPRFIVFEGLDGAGTSTQVYKLRDFLLTNNVNVEVTREPTSGPIGTAIRLAIEGRVSLDPIALALAFAADRADHLFNSYNGVLSSLKDERWVVSDRYILSSVAYQGMDIEDVQWLMDINKFIITPDLTIFVDTPVEICMRRLNSRSSHVELFHSKDKLDKISENFVRAANHPKLVGKLIVTDGSQDPDIVFNSFISSIKELIQGLN